MDFNLCETLTEKIIKTVLTRCEILLEDESLIGGNGLFFSQNKVHLRAK